MASLLPGDDSQFRFSSLREKILEHLFVGDLLRCLWKLGRRDIELLRAEVDFSGYDIVVECNGCARYIQLKSSLDNSATSKITVQLSLASKPNACVLWIRFNPETMRLGPFLWFGGEPHSSVPSFGDQVARHTRTNRSGVKAPRPNLREIMRSQFLELVTIEAVAEKLFGLSTPE